MTQQHTELETLTILRNEVQKRRMNSIAQSAFCKIKLKKEKNQADQLPFQNAIATNDSNAAADKLYLGCIDELITAEKARTNA